MMKLTEEMAQAQNTAGKINQKMREHRQKRHKKYYAEGRQDTIKYTQAVRYKDQTTGYSIPTGHSVPKTPHGKNGIIM